MIHREVVNDPPFTFSVVTLLADNPVAFCVLTFKAPNVIGLMALERKTAGLDAVDVALKLATLMIASVLLAENPVPAGEVIVVLPLKLYVL